jgi:hypothetical protein
VIGLLLVLALLGPALEDQPAAGSPTAGSKDTPPRLAVEKTNLAAPDATALLQIHRVFIDRLTGGATAAQIRDLIISALQGTRLFIITENEERADAFLRGAAEDLLYTDRFSSSEGVGSHASERGSRSESSGSGYSRAGNARSLGLAMGANEMESVHIEERKHEALATVRLTNKDGDVIWATTQESLGGKFRGAGADVADRIAKQLAADMDHARKGRRSQ